MMLRKKLGRKSAKTKRNGSTAARGARPRTSRSDGLHEIEDGWFICVMILSMIAWMMLFVSSLLLYVHKPFRQMGVWNTMWWISAIISLGSTLFLSWGWIDELIVFPIRSHLRYRAEQQRASSGKAV